MNIPLKAIFFYSSAFAAATLLALCIFLISISAPYPVIRRSKKEESYIDPVTGDSKSFPSISDTFSLSLSVIIPAYNEENRLPSMLEECVAFLEERCENCPSFQYEIIVVSDGSTDNTFEVAKEYCRRLGTEKFRILNLETNRGKGGAVRLGMQSARGALLLFADADGATKFQDLVKLEDNITELTKGNYMEDPWKISEEQAISIGSRAHLEQEAIATRSLFRTVLMHGFHFLVWLFAVRGLKDTQCGFKILTRSAARTCFQSLHVERWAFDVELLYIAQTVRIPVGEVAVNWMEIEGSKLTPVWSWIQMGCDLGLIWLRYTIGAWKINSGKSD